jgi:hypothetical protein
LFSSFCCGLNAFFTHPCSLAIIGVCCEIDESCGSVRKYIFDMENCLTFSHEFLDRHVGDFYWENGSLARKSEYRHAFRLKRRKTGDKEDERG